MNSKLIATLGLLMCLPFATQAAEVIRLKLESGKTVELTRNDIINAVDSLLPALVKDSEVNHKALLQADGSFRMVNVRVPYQKSDGSLGGSFVALVEGKEKSSTNALCKMLGFSSSKRFTLNPSSAQNSKYIGTAKTKFAGQASLVGVDKLNQPKVLDLINDGEAVILDSVDCKL